jgi:hypothetical protein
MKTELPGSPYEQVTNIDEVEVSTTLCKDNKLVHMLSTFSGKQPITEVRWRDKGTGEHIKVNCPAVFREYNQHIGAVYLVDSLIGRYKLKMQTHKLYIRIFYHLLDVTVVYSWVLYRLTWAMALSEYRVSLAESLCKANQPTKRGRPSNETNATIEVKWLKPTTKSLPTRDVREDGIGHFPIWFKTRGRCKLPLCTCFSFIMCEKCDVFLCLNKARNCFDFLCNNKSRLIISWKITFF